MLLISGRKTNVPTICGNVEYATLIEQLHSMKQSVTSVLVAFDMDHMEPYRVHACSAMDPQHMSRTGESTIGTQVRYSYSD